MPRKPNQKLKLIYILDILKKYSDEDNPINATDIVNFLDELGIEAERKSIYSDIEALELYGCDIIKTTTPKKGWFIGQRQFEAPEIYLLSDAVRTAKFISVKKTRELLSKLNSMLSTYQVSKRDSAVYFDLSNKCDNEEIYYSIDKLTNAIQSKKQVKFYYQVRTFDENRDIKKYSKQMIINPYALTWQDDHYYLVGNYLKYDNLIHLRLDRISKVEILDTDARHFSEVSDYRDFFDIADYTKKLFDMYSGELCDVELCCNKQIAEQVFDRFSEDIFIKKVTENEFNITIKAVISEALVTWIFKFGKNIKVIKPENLIDMVICRAKEVIDNYGE